jgi:hypothetical protein
MEPKIKIHGMRVVVKQAPMFSLTLPPQLAVMIEALMQN